MLFDLGDIAALPPRKLLRVGHVFVSHAHMDHFAGFDRLLRLLLGRDTTVCLYGPAGFIDRVAHKLHSYTWNLIHGYTGNLVFEVDEVDAADRRHRARFQSREAFRRETLPDTGIEDGVLARSGGLLVRCAVLDHGTPCLGFALEEPAHVNIWKTRLDALGLQAGPWLRHLKQAVITGAPETTLISALRRTEPGSAPVSLPLSALRGLAQVGAGQKIAYVVDVRHNAANAAHIESLAFGADRLFIECAFLEVDAEHAARKNHLTARQAGALARRAQVKQLVSCHFSTRYADRGEELTEEAQRAFRGEAA